MSVEVVMPQMGESITEGTVSKWLKAIGERVEKDEPLLEISTDKVDAEVPAADSGVLLEIRAKEGETVEVGTVVAVIGAEGESTTAAPPAAEATRVEEAKPIAEVPQAATVPVQTQTQAATPTAETSKAAAPTTPVANATDVVMPQMGESIT